MRFRGAYLALWSLSLRLPAEPEYIANSFESSEPFLSVSRLVNTRRVMPRPRCCFLCERAGAEGSGGEDREGSSVLRQHGVDSWGQWKGADAAYGVPAAAGVRSLDGVNALRYTAGNTCGPAGSSPFICARNSISSSSRSRRQTSRPMFIWISANCAASRS
jgi:hypothetical protein